MKITSAKKHIINAYNKKIACMLWGPCGVGKSSLVKQVAQDLKMPLIDLRLPQLEPPDIRGIPAPNHQSKKAEWFYPEYLPDSGKGILFLDEIEKAPVAVKNAALQLILDREIGSYRLPDGWSIVAAGNREDDGCFSLPLGSALCNRMIHLNIEPDYEAWLGWARENNISNGILGYLAFRPDHLYTYNAGDVAFPTPRSWEMLNTMLDGVDKVGEQNELLRAVVGDAVGLEYRTWLVVYKNVKVEDIVVKGKLPNFDEFEKGKEKSFMYAVTIAVAHYVEKMKSFSGLEANIAKFVEFLEPELRVAWTKQISVDRLIKLVEHSSFKPIADRLVSIIMSR
jgi:ATPase family associated with various cellular activities (AAA)